MNNTLEYMALANAQVAFDVEEFGRQVMALLDDSEQRERMGQIARQRIENELGRAHTHKQLLEAYAWLFRQIRAPRRARRRQ